MEQIINYLNIPRENREAVLTALLHLGFFTQNGLEALKHRLDAAEPDQLPQYRFVFRDGTLIGYSFLYGETGPHCIGGGGQSNVDELPLPLAIQIMEEDIAVLEEHGCSKMAAVTRMLLENQKKGLGRRCEADCR